MKTRRDRFQTSTYLNIGMSIAFALFGVVVILLVNYHMRRQALDEARSKVMLLLDRSLATHTYFTHQLKPRLFELTDPITSQNYFDPVWMSSTYAVREIHKYFTLLDNEEYYYKECAINARSPENEADAYEKAFLQELNSNQELIEKSGIRTQEGEPFFVTLRRGESMESSCLRCHSTPDRAPGGLVETYGDERSFGRDLGETVSAISIRIPLAAAYASANRISLELSGILLVLLVGLFLFQYWFYRRLLFSPLDTLRTLALNISTDGRHLGEEIPAPAGRDLQELTSAFNTMSTALKQNHNVLEGEVRRRTAELRDVNESLRESEEAFRDLYDDAPIPYFSIGVDATIHRCNRRVKDLLGYERDELVGRSVFDLYADTPDGKEKAKSVFQRFVSGETVDAEELQMQRADGTPVWVSFTVNPVKDRRGNVVESRSMAVDISDRKRIEIALHERVKELNCLVAISGIVNDPSLSLDEIHQQVVERIPLSWLYPEIVCARIELNGKEFKTHNYRSTEWKLEQEITVRGEKAGVLEVCYLEKRPDESRGPFLEEEVTLMESIAERLGKNIEQTQAEERLKKSEALYRTLVENLRQNVFLKDTESRFVSANSSFCALLGVRQEDIVGKTDYDFYPKELAEKYRADDRKVMETGETLDDVEENVVGGRRSWVRVVKTPVKEPDGTVRGVLGIFWDITEQKDMETRLRESHKMEAVGRMAGGVAHNINNLLTGISGNLGLIQMTTSEDLSEYFSEAQGCVDRAAEFVQHLLAFGRELRIQPRPVDVNRLAEETADFIRQTIDRRIDIRVETTDDIPHALADEQQLKTILADFCMNSQDAIKALLASEESPETELTDFAVTIKTGSAEFGQQDMPADSSVRPGRFVTISVSDNGIGMDEETQSHLFEPFFTTKGLAQGKGLSLSSAHGIVNQQGGWIECHSRLGSGTTFLIHLPAAEGCGSPLLARKRRVREIAGNRHRTGPDDNTVGRR